MAALYRAAGRWEEVDFAVPKPGDLVFYDWDGNRVPDHVGLVADAEGDAVTVIEGNKSDAVGKRRLHLDDKNILGYGQPDYFHYADKTGSDVPDPDFLLPNSELSLPLLALGDRGESVRAAQLLLIGRGCSCGKCGYASPKADHEVTGTEDGKLVIDGKWEVAPQILNEAFAQNIIAAYTAAVEAIGIDPQKAAELIDGIELDNGRVVEFDLNGHPGRFMLCKHENSMAYNGAISTALRDPSEEVTVVFIVDRLSRKYVANDMSWLWDIDFNRFADPKVKKVILSGGFAHDAAERMLVGGVQEEKLIIEPDLDEMMRAAEERSEGTIYVMTCFTDQYKFLDRLKKYGREAAK